MALSEAQGRISLTNWACNPADLFVMKVSVMGKDGQVGVMKIIIGNRAMPSAIIVTPQVL